MSNENENQQPKHQGHQTVIIGKDGKVHTPAIRFYLALGCNLKCKHCIYAFRQGIIPKETLIDSFEKWNRKLSPELIILYGGEPLLNPEIADIVIAVKHYWQQSQCLIFTNGILLPRLPDSTLQVFAENNVQVHISQHIVTQEYRDTLKQSLFLLGQFGIKYSIANAFRNWHRTYDIDNDGVPMPCQSDMKTAYKNCTAKYCTLVHGNYLYRCVGLANKIMAAEAGIIGQEWNDRVLTHKPVTFESSPKEICDYLLKKAVPECSVCPETRESVEHSQLSTEEVTAIKSCIAERNKSKQEQT